MATVWILVLLAGNSVAVVNLPFRSEEACETAGKIYQKPGAARSYSCVPLAY